MDITARITFIQEKCSVDATCLKCHFQNKRMALRKVYVGTGLVISVIHLLLTPVADKFMRLGYQDEGLRILESQ